jgi:hypothetical protein
MSITAFRTPDPSPSPCHPEANQRVRVVAGQHPDTQATARSPRDDKTRADLGRSAGFAAHTANVRRRAGGGGFAVWR